MSKYAASFIREVTSQIRSKKAKRNIESELTFHLNQSKEQWMEKGLNEEAAEIKAVEQMGNPVMLGVEFNKLHSPSPLLYFKPLLLHLLISLIAGIVLNAVLSIDYFKDHIFAINVTYVIVTLSASYLYFYFGYRFLKGFSKELLIKSVAIIFVMNIGLALSGQLLLNNGSGIAAENGQFIILVFLAFNFGLYTIFELLPAMPGLVSMFLISLASPLLLYMGSKKSIKVLDRRNHVE